MDPITYIAETDFRHAHRVFGIQPTDRRTHMWVLGKTGVGKSNLLKSLIIQDLRNGHGVAVIDPHGELVRGLLDFIPKERTWQTVYFNPADQDFPIGFNILEQVAPELRPLVASHVLSVFKHIWADSWGPRTEYLLHNAVISLLDVPGSTLLSIPRLLADKDFRARVVAQVHDPAIRAFWLQEYEAYSGDLRKEAISPIQNKVGQFLTSYPIRNIVGQVTSKMEMAGPGDKAVTTRLNHAPGGLVPVEILEGEGVNRKTVLTFDPETNVLTAVGEIKERARTEFFAAAAEPEFKEAVDKIYLEASQFRVSVWWLIAFYLVLTMGELCLSPVGLSLVTKLAPPKHVGLMMGGWFLATAVAEKLAQVFGAHWGRMPPVDYFLIFVVMCAVGAILMAMLIRPLKRMMHGVH